MNQDIFLFKQWVANYLLEEALKKKKTRGVKGVPPEVRAAIRGSQEHYSVLMARYNLSYSTIWKYKNFLG